MRVSESLLSRSGDVWSRGYSLLLSSAAVVQALEASSRCIWPSHISFIRTLHVSLKAPHKGAS